MIDDAAGRTETAGDESGALERTLRWAERAQAARRRPEQAVFAIVQGGASSRSLRQKSAEATAQLEFDGYAHGGLGLGETREERRAAVATANAALPPDRPRYLMGLGRPIDLLDGVAAGVDLFDCVVPDAQRAPRSALHVPGHPQPAQRPPSPSTRTAADPDCPCPALYATTAGATCAI